LADPRKPILRPTVLDLPSPSSCRAKPPYMMMPLAG
jgi:hypothetical protein